MGNENTALKPSSPIANHPQRLLGCYKQAVHLAVSEKNYEYAHVLFLECVLHDPQNLQFVEGMMRNLHEIRRQTKVPLLYAVSGQRRKLAQLVRKEKWPEVLRTGITSLKIAPSDLTTLQSIAKACAALHYNEVELVYLKYALDVEPKNVGVNRHCGESLGRMGQFDQAIACWHRVEKLKGGDAEAASMISKLAAEKLQYPDGRPPMPLPGQESAVRDTSIMESRYTSPDTRGQLRGTRGGFPKNTKNEREDADTRVAQQRGGNPPVRTFWPKVGLGLALLALILQAVPGVDSTVYRILDARTWTETDWFIFSLVSLIGLLFARFAPHVVSVHSRPSSFLKRRTQ